MKGEMKIKGMFKESSESIEYWVERALRAEAYIEECPCDPDITEDQLKAYEEWLEVKIRYEKKK